MAAEKPKAGEPGSPEYLYVEVLREAWAQLRVAKLGDEGVIWKQEWPKWRRRLMGTENFRATPDQVRETIADLLSRVEVDDDRTEAVYALLRTDPLLAQNLAAMAAASQPGRPSEGRRGGKTTAYLTPENLGWLKAQGRTASDVLNDLVKKAREAEG